MQNLQNYLLCILYLILLIVHSQTICRRDYHQKLISVFSFALIMETLSTVFETLHQIVLSYGQELANNTNLDLTYFTNLHYSAQLIHITAINFFILFLLIISKGWPITRRDMSFKYAFAIFWLVCLAADLITFYWATITVLANNLANHNNGGEQHAAMLPNNQTTTMTSYGPNNSTTAPNINEKNQTFLLSSSHPAINLSTALIDSLPTDQEQFNSTPRRLSLLLRIVIMIYFLLELRTTMVLEQEKKKLQFYLNFGALTMVWFVHTLIVYIISLRVDSTWQSKLISGFSSAANFLGFAVTTRLLHPKNSRSYLFCKQKLVPSGLEGGDGCGEIDNLSTFNNEEDDEYYEGTRRPSEDVYVDDEYGGLEMKELSRVNRNFTNNSNHNDN